LSQRDDIVVFNNNISNLWKGGDFFDAHIFILMGLKCHAFIQQKSLILKPPMKG
jgi:hypothetical protein